MASLVAEGWATSRAAARMAGSRLGLALRVASLPALVAALLGLLFAMGSVELRTQQESMNAVVETDLERSARLAEINRRLQTANADMYRLMTDAAAGGKPTDYPVRIQDLSHRVEWVIGALRDYRNQEPAGAQRDMLDKFIDDIGLYKGAIDWLGSMLEIDFKTAVAFISPYNSHVDRMSRQLSAIIADSTVTAKARAGHASEALRRAAYYYVIAAVAVSLLVLVFAYLMVMRQERLTEASRSRRAQVATLLDNSGQGFLSLGPDMIVAREYSRACEDIFGRIPAGLPGDVLLFPADGEARTLMRTVAARVLAEADPVKRGIYLSLLPSEIALGDKVLEVEYKALEGAIMLVLTDVTEARGLARQVERERKRLEMIVSALSDSRDFFDAIESFRRFLAQNEGLAASGRAPADVLAEIYRQVHTFKGAFNQLSFHYLPEALHELEVRLQALRGETPTFEAIRRVVAETNGIGWLELDLDIVRDVLGNDFLEGRAGIRLSLADLHRLQLFAERLASVAPEGREMQEFLSALRKISLKRALTDFNDLVQRIAQRCGKSVAPLIVEGEDVLVDPESYHPLLRALGHVFRNAVDHGIEEPEVRIIAGKDECGHIHATIALAGGEIRIEIADDGAGLDLAALRRTAAAHYGEDYVAGLGADQLAELVFEDGTSTSTSASEISGRGVGLAAVRAAVDGLGGSVAVASNLGRGTRFTFTLPQPASCPAEAA